MVELKVSGMTCGGCARSVTRAVQSAIPGTAVEVDLASGRVQVDGTDDAAAAARAVTDAGYEVASVDA